MTQTRKQSLVETITTTAIGYCVALVTQLVVFPLYGLPIEMHQNMQIAAIFTGVSLVRGYFVRRFFNWWHASSKP